MNSLTALSRLLADRGGPHSQLKRARRRSQQQTQEQVQVQQQHEAAVVAAQQQEQTDEAPVASTSASVDGDSSGLDDSDADPDSARKPNSTTTTTTTTRRRLMSTRAAGVVANSLPIRMSVALLLCIRRILSRIFHIPFPPASSGSPPAPAAADEEPPPSYEAATSAASPSASSSSSWRSLLKSGPRSKPGVALAESPLEKHKRDARKSAQVALLQRPKTLVLDLDETLIHSSNNLTGLLSPSSNKWSNLSVRVVEVVLDSKSVVYHVYKRPWVDLFLKKVAAWYTVVIFTASIQEYADPVIDWLDQGKGLITARLFRESCELYRGAYSKDLSVISKDMSRLCLVDNSPAAYALNPANGIPIEGWVGDPNDESLLDLLPLLDSLRFTSDVRRVLGLRGFGRSSANPNSTSTTSMQL